MHEGSGYPVGPRWGRHRLPAAIPAPRVRIPNPGEQGVLTLRYTTVRGEDAIGYSMVDIAEFR